VGLGALVWSVAANVVTWGLEGRGQRVAAASDAPSGKRRGMGKKGGEKMRPLWKTCKMIHKKGGVSFSHRPPGSCHLCCSDLEFQP